MGTHKPVFREKFSIELLGIKAFSLSTKGFFLEKKEVWPLEINTMIKKIAIIQARMGSSRLPGKVMMDIQGIPVLQWVTQAALSINNIDNVIIATSTENQDDAIEKWCVKNNIKIFRGDEKNVLSRYYEAAKVHGLKSGDLVMRLTADCPLLDPQICGEVISLLLRTGKDYANNIGNPRAWPDGLDCEVFTFDALERSFLEASDDLYKEHVSLYIRHNPQFFDAISLSCPVGGIGDYRWTLDTQDDFEHLIYLTNHLQDRKPTYSYLDVLHIEQNDRTEKIGNIYGLGQSLSHLERALKTIPGASQTYSKSYVQHIKGVSPFFIDRGKGAYVWDIDGNEYVDYLSALLPVLLGYCDDDVDEAIKAQLSKGICFSLAADIEAELAEILINMIPSAEMVRFAKNGSDVTAGAIRIARAYTGRTQVAICGYHGWHDWYIGTTALDRGVPYETKNLTDTFSFNKIESLKKLLAQKQYAAIILEAEATEKSQNGFLEEVRKLSTEHGAVLIFDEIVSGFRSSLGGIQELRGVVPDLSCFGKAMGNGMPISALVGKREVMHILDDVFFSGTFGGETLSIAAAITCLNKYKRTNGVEKIKNLGTRLQGNINNILKAEGINGVLSVQGESWWPAMKISHSESDTLKMLIRQELARNGIIQGSGFNLSVSHCNDTIWNQTMEAWENIAMSLNKFLNGNSLEKYLNDGKENTVFKVRQ